MVVVTPEETHVLTSKFNEEAWKLGKHLSIYLGGSIDYDDPKSDWQSKVIVRMADTSIDYGRDTVVYNPRKMCGTNTPGWHEFLRDESWKEKCLKKSDIIVVNFVPGYEDRDGFGLLSSSELRDHMMVFCPYDSKSFNTAKYVCEQYGIYFVTGNTLDENDILEALFEWADE